MGDGGFEEKTFWRKENWFDENKGLEVVDFRVLDGWRR
jgi:hypothetical protein